MSFTITATTESNPDIINTWRRYWYQGAWQYWELRTVAWISQDSSKLESTIKYKWQIYQYNYYPKWEDSHTYTLSFGDTSDSVSFAMPQSQSNGTRDMCSARTLGTFKHNTSTGELSGTFEFEGAQCGGYRADGSYVEWSTFDEEISGSVKSIPIPEPEPEPSPEPTPTPEPEPEPPTPLEFDNDPHYYIYADGNLVYAAGVEGYYVTNPKLTLEVNKAGSLTFDLPVGSEMYNQISKLKTTVECRQGNEVLFRGRLLNTKRNMMNTITCYCEGFLSWMNDIVLTPYTRSNMQARDLLKLFLTWYDSRASQNRQITYKYSDISANVSIESKDHSNCWEQIKKVLIDGVGGYVVPYLTASETGIQWLSTYGASTSQIIQFGSNIKDIEEYIDASEIFTAVRPYGKEVNGTRVSLAEEFVTNNDAINTFGRIERTVFFDEITSESALRTAASTYLRTGIQSAMTMTVKAVDLHLLDVDIERIRLGDSVRVVSVPHQIDAYFLCTKMSIDMAHPQNSVYTFGATQRTISELTNPSYNRYIISEGA